MAPAIARTSNAADRPNPQMHTALRFVLAFPQLANPAALKWDLASEDVTAHLHALVRGGSRLPDRAPCLARQHKPILWWQCTSHCALTMFDINPLYPLAVMGYKT
ncbi:MAG: hypothetical protein Q4A97_08140 [Comamonadaceae bacterium]|nr:hypothetical protein [Comamonadaceae bacterium]